jgi:hypothetical protein
VWLLTFIFFYRPIIEFAHFIATPLDSFYLEFDSICPSKSRVIAAAPVDFV